MQNISVAGVGVQGINIMSIVLAQILSLANVRLAVFLGGRSNYQGNGGGWPAVMNYFNS